MSMINIIAAIQRKDRGLGFNNDLLYQLPEDMKFFREKTRDSVVIMGRKTWESIPEKFRPLPHRDNIVVTRDKTYDAPGGHVVHSLEEAFALSATNFPDKEVFVIGGGELYTQALPFADKLYLTIIDGDKSADTFFPAYEEDFKIVAEQKAQSSTGPSFCFCTLTRI